MESCAELLRSCEINILVVFSDIPVVCLDSKLPTTLNIELVTITYFVSQFFKMEKEGKSSYIN